jgi:glucosylceramidase
VTIGTRRRFLTSAAAAAATLTIGGHRNRAGAETGAGKPVKIWATYRDRRYAPGDALAWKAATQVNADAIVLDVSTVKQEILGFGGALTDATCYVLTQMPPGQREALMHDLFAPEELALNVCRTTIGASDYSLNAYTYDESDQPDPALKKFSIGHDEKYILPVLRDARRINPGIFLFSSPWSPPGWMKSANTIFGGTMRSMGFGPYAEYFRRFLSAYQAAGVGIDAVTVQNEVDSEQEGNMPQCIWGQQYEIQFVRDYLGPALRKAGLPAKIWVLDHNYDLWGRAIDELSDPGAYEYIDGIAWHGYMGDPSAMTQVHDQFPAKSAYWTEGGPDISQPDYQTDWAKWGEVFNGILNNWARSITSWNLALDEKGKPNIGPFSCGGVVTVENGSHKITRSGQYWAFAHYSKHIQRGARAIAANGIEVAPRSAGLLTDNKSTALTRSAFRNPDGSTVVVLANRGGQRDVQLIQGTMALDVSVPADSLLTLQWA